MARKVCRDSYRASAGNRLIWDNIGSMKIKILLSTFLVAGVLASLAATSPAAHKMSATKPSVPPASQTLSISGSYTSSKAGNGDVTITLANGVVVFEAAQPVPIVVVGMKQTDMNLIVQSNPNHVSLSASGSGTTDAKITGPGWSIEATGVVTTISGV